MGTQLVGGEGMGGPFIWCEDEGDAAVLLWVKGWSGLKLDAESEIVAS